MNGWEAASAIMFVASSLGSLAAVGRNRLELGVYVVCGFGVALALLLIGAGR